VSSTGVIMVADQRIRVGKANAGLTVTVTTDGDTFRVHHDGRELAQVQRITSKPIARFKARKPEPPRRRDRAE
jgi:hypothetical protein